MAVRKPVKAETFIASMFRHWPTLFRSRLDVLNQIFFTIGNGCAWHEGS